ncbi:MAG: PIN domain-containing protein [Gemmatimonadetes bacterium]|nr:PIN domain-containing protein [Gemmatimonadota bacterium]
MAGEVFVDAGVWYAALNPKATDHRPCVAALKGATQSRHRRVTTNLVVAEAHALLLSRVHRRAALEFLRAVQLPPTTVVESTVELEQRALNDWIERYDDQRFSLADAVSFAVMADRGIKEALTLDRHFAAAGFRAVP